MRALSCLCPVRSGRTYAPEPLHPYLASASDAVPGRAGHAARAWRPATEHWAAVPLGAVNVKSGDRKSEASNDLRRLMAGPARCSALQIWRRLEDDERAEVAQAFMDAPAPEKGKSNRSMVVDVVAAARNFRPATVQKWGDAKIAAAMSRGRLGDARRAADLIRHLPDVPRRQPMAQRFTGLLGLATPNDIVDASAELDEDAVRRAASALQDEYGQREAAVYFLALAVRDGPAAEGLRTWMREQAQEAPAHAEDEAQEAPADAEAAPDELGREQEFTTLDRVLMQTVVDAKHGVEGSLAEDEVDDMVEDYIHLNGKRHRSHFHAGFRDALFERSVDAPAQDRRRARWYWAGAVQGWSRSESWERIVRAYDEHELVQGLGDSSAAALAAARTVVRALREQGRVDELAKFVKPAGLAASPNTELFRSLLDAATGLLRERDAARAIHIFRLLDRVAGKQENDAFSDGRLDVQRRLAHCHRELGQPDRARRILKDFLRQEITPASRAMATADLGLLEGGFRSLDDVRLPLGQERLEGVKQALAFGRDHFESSVENDVRYASHGHYCLGVLALCKEQYGQARKHLEEAHTSIVGGTGHYDAKLRACIVLYLGIATILAVLESSQSDHSASEMDLQPGARRIEKGLKEGSAFPPYLVEDAMIALDCGSKADLSRIAELVLEKAEKGDERILDALAASEPAIQHCKPLAQALLRRACREGRPKTDAAADLRKALRGFRHADSTDEALKVLDRLEGYAFDGIDRDEFMDLMKGEGNNYDCPPFEPDEARHAHARCLADAGQVEAAAIVLGEMFHGMVSRQRKFDAEGVLDRIKELGDPASNYADLHKRLPKIAPASVREEKPRYDAQRGVKVLVVGGDAERQSKYDDRVLKEVRRESEAIQIEFIRSGWGADWRRHLERAVRLLRTYDAVVLMRFMRTHFGKKLREECGKANRPWRFCWSGGAEAQARAVIEAAREANRRLNEAPGGASPK